MSDLIPSRERLQNVVRLLNHVHPRTIFILLASTPGETSANEQVISSTTNVELVRDICATFLDRTLTDPGDGFHL